VTPREELAEIEAALGEDRVSYLEEIGVCRVHALPDRDRLDWRMLHDARERVRRPLDAAVLTWADVTELRKAEQCSHQSKLKIA
jgi:hypothetical protein